MIQQNSRKIVQIGPIAVEIHVKSNASALEFNPEHQFTFNHVSLHFLSIIFSLPPASPYQQDPDLVAKEMILPARSVPAAASSQQWPLQNGLHLFHYTTIVQLFPQQIVDTRDISKKMLEKTGLVSVLLHPSGLYFATGHCPYIVSASTLGWIGHCTSHYYYNPITWYPTYYSPWLSCNCIAIQLSFSSHHHYHPIISLLVMCLNNFLDPQNHHFYRCYQPSKMALLNNCSQMLNHA